MTDIYLHGRPINTVFDLLGSKENDITFSVGWALAQSEQFQRQLLKGVFPQLPVDAANIIRLQEHQFQTGYTDIEIETDAVHVIIEAKRGWSMPTEAQLKKYSRRFKDVRRSNAIVVMSECSTEFVAHSDYPESIRGIPVQQLSWREVFKVAGRAKQLSGIHAEKHLLQDLQQYLQGIMSMQDQESNLVYVVALNTEVAEGSSLTWIEFVTKRRHYFHPFGGSGWPTTPPNYLGFRYGGKLQRIHHVEKYEIVYDLAKYIPEVNARKWREAHGEYPEILYWLGPAIVPSREVKTGNIFSAGRLWAALDLLLTSPTVADACMKTKKRLKKLRDVT